MCFEWYMNSLSNINFGFSDLFFAGCTIFFKKKCNLGHPVVLLEMCQGLWEEWLWHNIFYSWISFFFHFTTSFVEVVSQNGWEIEESWIGRRLKPLMWAFQWPMKHPTTPHLLRITCEWFKKRKNGKYWFPKKSGCNF